VEYENANNNIKFITTGPMNDEIPQLELNDREYYFNKNALLNLGDKTITTDNETFKIADITEENIKKFTTNNDKAKNNCKSL
jgi:hypothetical protein